MATIKSDKELKKTFEVFIDEEDIIWGTLLKEIKGLTDNARQVELIEEIVLEIFNKNPEKKYKIVLNLLPLGKGKVYTSAENRKAWARLAFHKQIEKCAVIGLSIILKTITNFVIRLSGRNKDIKWFSSKEKAIEWLKK